MPRSLLIMLWILFLLIWEVTKILSPLLLLLILAFETITAPLDWAQDEIDSAAIKRSKIGWGIPLIPLSL
ncbi:MAG: hypothetical protein K0Q90_1402 [Paenibacillaceae bacterium]|jgi:hypothetical protein|nr:hypothetical protein [Paenibacillaceae bacterium]